MIKLSSQRIILLRWLLWFFLGNVVLFSLIGLRYISWISPENYYIFTSTYVILTWLFIGVTVPGHFALLAFLTLFPILILILLLPKRFIIIPVASVLSAVAVWLLVTDTIVFSQYRFHLNGVIINMFLDDASGEVFNLTKTEWMTATSVGIFFLCLEFIYGIWLWRKQALWNIHRAFRISIGLAICLLFSYFFFLLSNVQTGYSGISQQPQAFPLYNVILSRLLPVPDGLDALETAGSVQFSQPGQAAKKLNYPLKPLQCTAPTQPLNIVFIVIDSWRFDMLNRQVMPHATEFSEKSTRFMQHYSGGNSTQAGIFSLFYGLPGTYWTAMLEQKKGPVLIKALLEEGYRTGIFSSARLSMPAFDETVFRDVPEVALNMPGYTAIQRDRHITAEFKHFVKQSSSKPFFSFLFYDAAHSYCDSSNLKPRFLPIVSECNRVTLTSKINETHYLNRYKNALYSVDQQINEVLLTLKKQNLLQNTVIVLTSDHGEEFNDEQRGYTGHAGNFTDYQVKVPLVIYWPGQKPKVIKKQTSHYDIAPTLLTKVFGCQNLARDYSAGQLLESNTPPPKYHQVASYVNFGIRQPDRITTVFRTGNFKVEDLNGKAMPNAPLDKDAIKEVFELMNRFYVEEKTDR